MADFGDLLSKAKQAQEKLQELQRELATRRVEGSAGGGMVRAEVSGAMRVLAVHIEPELLDSGDREMLQDLVAAALNAALENAQRMMQEEMQRASSGLGLFPGAS